MKKILLVTASLLALSATAASAADLAARPYTKAPPPMLSTVYDWTGFYVGINGGWAQSHDNRSIDGVGSIGSHDADGGTVGGQVGYRWQSGAFVFGLEAQGNWADISGSSTNLAVAGGQIRSKTDAFGLFTGQVGYAWNNVLLYAKGGAAVTDRNYEFLAPGGALASSTGYDTRWSPTVGAGLEFAFSQGWSIGVEYNHIFEDRHGATFVTPGGLAVSGFSSGGDTDMVLGRLNYKFGGPIIARY
jgi:outer membrane immunogenic protein